MKAKELEKRIAELEDRIKALEARPSTEQHFHYHWYQQPAYGITYGNPIWMLSANSQEVKL